MSTPEPEPAPPTTGPATTATAAASISLESDLDKALSTLLPSSLGTLPPNFVKECLGAAQQAMLASRTLPDEQNFSLVQSMPTLRKQAKALENRAASLLAGLINLDDPEFTRAMAKSWSSVEESTEAFFGRIDDALSRIARGDLLPQASNPDRALSPDAQKKADFAKMLDLAHKIVADGSKVQNQWRADWARANQSTRFIPKVKPETKVNGVYPLQKVTLEAIAAAASSGKTPEEQGDSPRARTRSEAFNDMTKIVTQNAAAAAPLPHPYAQEIADWLQEAQAATKEIESLPTPQLPKSDDETPFQYIESFEDFSACVDDILASGVKELAIDLEHHSYRSYRGFLCLLQMSTRDKDYVIDPFPFFEQIGPVLNRLTTNPEIVKVFHGGDMDMQWLQRDWGVYVVNMFDTGQATRVLEMPGGYSLGNALDVFCSFKADKRLQLADWRARPLPDDCLAYARSDTHYLLYVYDRLRVGLLAKTPDMGAGEIAAVKEGSEVQVTSFGKRLLCEVLQRSADVSLKTYQERVFSADIAASSLCARTSVMLKPPQFAALKGLLKWRDAVARELDESTEFVLKNQLTLRIAQITPSQGEHLIRVIGASATRVQKALADMACSYMHEAVASQLKLSHPGTHHQPTRGAAAKDGASPSPSSTPPPAHKSAEIQVLPSEAARNAIEWKEEGDVRVEVSLGGTFFGNQDQPLGNNRFLSTVRRMAKDLVSIPRPIIEDIARMAEAGGKAYRDLAQREEAAIAAELAQKAAAAAVVQEEKPRSAPLGDFLGVTMSTKRPPDVGRQIGEQRAQQSKRERSDAQEFLGGSGGPPSGNSGRGQKRKTEGGGEEEQSPARERKRQHRVPEPLPHQQQLQPQQGEPKGHKGKGKGKGGKGKGK